MKKETVVSRKSLVVRQQSAVGSWQLGVKLFVLVMVFTIHCSLFTVHCFSQVGVNTTGAAPVGSAMLDVISTTRGMLITRMTKANREAIASPVDGLMIYNTDCGIFEYYNGTKWVPIYSTGNLLLSPGSISGARTVTSGQSGVVYSIFSVPGTGATSYKWTIPAGATMTGDGTTSITVHFGSTPGNICVSASNACGASLESCITISFSK